METWPDEDVPSVPMLVMTTSSVALAKVDAARASSSAVVFVRRRKDFTPEILSRSVTPEGACQNGFTTEDTESTEGSLQGRARAPFSGVGFLESRRLMPRPSSRSPVYRYAIEEG